MYKRLLLLLLTSVILSTYAYSQRISVESFQMALTDLSASRFPRKDLNDNHCALVKVMFVEKGAVFEGSVMGTVENKTNEYWVYMPAGSKRIRVKHPDYLPLNITFSDYNIQPLDGKATYKLTLVAEKSDSQDSVDPEFAATIDIKCPDTSATIYLNDEYKGEGSWKGVVLAGNYFVEARKDGFPSQHKSVSLNPKDSVSVLFKQFQVGKGQLKASFTPADAKLFLDGKYIGDASGTFSDIDVGSHTVSVSKEGFSSYNSFVNIISNKTTTLQGQLIENK